MADVTINYNGSKIAEFSGGSKTVETAGMYCEGDIEVNYSPNSKTYEITLTKASGWILLTTLDSEVVSHINDASLAVSLVNTSAYGYDKNTLSMCIVSNTPWGKQGNYSTYGFSGVVASETSTTVSQSYYAPNKTDTSTSIGGGGMFRISGNQYYFRPGGYYTRAGTYKLTFTW
jgi:hypothetical protein